MKAKPKKILFFSCEPGGAEVLIPAIRLVQAQPHLEAVVLGYGHALERFAKKNVAYDVIEQVPLDDFSLLDHYAPNLLITSATSLPSVDMTEKHLWQQARQRGITSLAFLDQWQNYALRFSGSKDHERLAYLPDWINCLNEIGRKEMIKEGFDVDSLVMLGHPYLSSLKYDISIIDVPRLKERFHLMEEDNVVLFVSEPIREYCGDQRCYDQYRVLDYFLANIATAPERPKILVKLHPKDNLASFQNLAEKFATLSPQFIKNELCSLECIAIADSIFGMSSIMLIEAYVLEKTVVSLQPGLCVEDPMVLSRHNLIPLISSNDENQQFIECTPSRYREFDVEFSAEKFLRFVEGVIQ